jgi:hypothetical protein
MHTAVQDTSGESQRMPIGGCCAPDVCFWCACMTRLRGRVSRHRSDSSSRPIQALAPVNDTSEQSLIPLTYRPPLPTSRHPRRASQICSFSAVTANDDWTREPRRDTAQPFAPGQASQAFEPSYKARNDDNKDHVGTAACQKLELMKLNV